HQLIVIQAQFLCAIAKQHLNISVRGDMRQEPLGTRLQITGGPVPHLRESRPVKERGDHHLRAVQAAYSCVHYMHKHALRTL
ncbi:MAG: hypothetical protein M3Y76_14065, partial [Chloroflexota bacterium]|nr:hypothetical protein [Chloroflexota bacterium]